MTGDPQEADAAISAAEMHLYEPNTGSLPVKALLRAQPVRDFIDGARARRSGRLLRQAAALSHDPRYRGDASRPGGQWSGPDEESA